MTLVALPVLKTSFNLILKRPSSWLLLNDRSSTFVLFDPDLSETLDRLGTSQNARPASVQGGVITPSVETVASNESSKRSRLIRTDSQPKKWN
jgi:hypothetical protein